MKEVLSRSVVRRLKEQKKIKEVDGKLTVEEEGVTYDLVKDGKKYKAVPSGENKVPTPVETEEDERPLAHKEITPMPKPPKKEKKVRRKR